MCSAAQRMPAAAAMLLALPITLAESRQPNRISRIASAELRQPITSAEASQPNCISQIGRVEEPGEPKAQRRGLGAQLLRQGSHCSSARRFVRRVARCTPLGAADSGLDAADLGGLMRLFSGTMRLICLPAGRW